MVLKYTADNLIELVRDAAMLPDSASGGTADEDILQHINHAMLSEIFPQVAKLREEYFVVEERVALGATQSKYRINHRAMGNRIRDIYYSESSDNNSRRFLDLVDRGEIPLWTSDDSLPQAFYLEGNYIVLLPAIDGGKGSLEISFFFRPGELVLLAETREVTALVGTNEVTLDVTIPTTPTAWSVTNTFDIHSGNSGAEIAGYSLAATTVTGTQIIFTPKIDGSVFGSHPVAVGDKVCLAEEAALPALPRELHPLVGQAAACRILNALGDMEGYAAAVNKLQRMQKDSEYLLESRVEGKPHIINNQFSLFRTSRGGRQRQDSFGFR